MIYIKETLKTYLLTTAANTEPLIYRLLGMKSNLDLCAILLSIDASDLYGNAAYRCEVMPKKKASAIVAPVQLGLWRPIVLAPDYKAQLPAL